MLSKRLRKLRMDKGITQNEISEILKITREAYCMYETGKRQISPESICKLADYYNISTDYLFGRKEMNEDIFKLSKEEIEILSKYRELDERGQENVNAIIEFEHQRTEVKKKVPKSAI